MVDVAVDGGVKPEPVGGLAEEFEGDLCYAVKTLTRHWLVVLVVVAVESEVKPEPVGGLAEELEGDFTHGCL